MLSHSHIAGLTLITKPTTHCIRKASLKLCASVSKEGGRGGRGGRVSAHFSFNRAFLSFLNLYALSPSVSKSWFINRQTPL
jgi:hypothetical protein